MRRPASVIFCWHLGSRSQKEQDPDPQPSYIFKDPDPYQNVTDPENWSIIQRLFLLTYTGVSNSVTGSGLKLVSDSDLDPDPAQNLDADPDPDPDPGGGGVGQPKTCIPPGKILGTPLKRAINLSVDIFARRGNFNACQDSIVRLYF